MGTSAGYSLSYYFFGKDILRKKTSAVKNSNHNFVERGRLLNPHVADNRALTETWSIKRCKKIKIKKKYLNIFVIFEIHVVNWFLPCRHNNYSRIIFPSHLPKMASSRVKRSLRANILPSSIEAIAIRCIYVVVPVWLRFIWK